MVELTQPSIAKPLAIVGFKPIDSYYHNTTRIVLAFLLFVVFIILFYYASRTISTNATLHDIEDIFPEGTQMHAMIDELDDNAKHIYITSLKKSITALDNSSLALKITKSVAIALIAGIITEYIINGNVIKSAGLIGKTSISTAIATMCA